MERGIWKPKVELVPTCPRCGSTNTKFCYYNNYSLTQPRYFCKGCRRYWTKGGSLRNVPIGGGGCRKSRRGKSSSCTIHHHHQQHGLISRNLGHGVCLNPTSIDHNQSNSNSSLDHHGPSIDLALVYANFLNSDNFKPSQSEDHQNHELPGDILLPNQEGVLVTPSFEFSSMINMDFMTSNLGQKSRLIDNGDGDDVDVYLSAIHEEKQDIVNHINDVHDDHCTNMNVNANNYMELPPLPGKEMMWSNNSHGHHHMVFPNDIRLEPKPKPDPELVVEDLSHGHNVSIANDGSLFNLSNFKNIFRP